MRIRNVTLMVVILTAALTTFAQTVVPLPTTLASDPAKWVMPERSYFSDIWRTEVVTNVSKPSILVYLPKKKLANGTAAIVAPGGGFWALSINSEGIDVAKWLNAKGIAAFVLKYRLTPSATEDAVKEVSALFADPKTFIEKTGPYIPYALSDGMTALRYVREHAAEYHMDPKKLGIVGFSAGGTVAANAAFNYSAAERPAFAAPIYPSLDAFANSKVPADAPPLFITVASNDQFNFAPASVDLYKKWQAAGKVAEVHVYSTGGHGFGMRTQNLPTDHWIELFYSFLKVEVIDHK